MGETATITVLFTDVVGSTTLYDRYGPDVSDALRRAQFVALRTAVAQHRGDEIKSTGDGLMVAFASAADAVACAVEMQQSLARVRQADRRAPATRIGISVGEATREDGDWYGPPVVEAARLCDGAAGDQILATAIVAALVGTRGVHEFVDLGLRELKGFTAAVAVHEVAWTPIANATPLPYAATAPREGPFLGRADETGALLDAWRATTDGQGGLVFVSGEPGIGKTRLLAEVAAAAHADGGQVLWGRCDDELSVPFQPFVEALRGFIDAVPAEDLARLAPAPDLLRLVPELKESLPDLEPPQSADVEIERLRMFDAVVGFLAAVAREAPTLLVLDDLHWATKPTVILLRYLVDVGRSPPGLLVAGAYRDTDLDRTHPLSAALGDLRRSTPSQRFSLGGLGVDDVAAFAEALGGTDAVAGPVHDETEGNPLFVGEVLRHLADMDWAPDEHGIPEGVRDAIGRRLSRLSDAANRVLAAGAVMGQEFDLAVLEAIVDPSHDVPVLDALEEAVAARIVIERPRPAGRFAFSHAVVRHVLYAEQSAARRTRLHRAIAEAIEGAPGATAGRAAALAHHYTEGAGVGGVAKAAEWTHNAAVAARDRLAYEEVVDLAQRLLQLLDLQDPPDHAARAQALIALAGAHMDVGDPPSAREVGLEVAVAARAAGRVDLLVAAADIRITWALAGTTDEAGEALMLEALDAVGDSDAGLRARLLATLAFYRSVYLGHGWDVADLIDEAMDEGRRADSVLVLSRVMAMRCFAMQGSPDVDAQLRYAQELADLEPLLPDTRWQESIATDFFGDRSGVVMTVQRHRPTAALQGGDVSEFDAGIARMKDGFEREGFWTTGAFISMWSALRALMDGRFTDAEGHATALLAITDDINFTNSWAGQMFAIRHDQGRLEEVRSLFVDVAAQTPGLVALQSLVALAAAEAGDRDEALAILRSLVGEGAEPLPANSTLPALLAYLATTAALLDVTDGANVLLDWLEPYSGQLLVAAWGVICPGAADRFSGMLLTLLGRHDEAVARFEAALALERSVDAHALIARTLFWYARALHARGALGDADAAAALTAECTALAEGLGMAGLLR